MFQIAFALRVGWNPTHLPEFLARLDLLQTSAKSVAQSIGDEMDEDSDDETNVKEEEYDSKGRKMTDEEKRKNFLERNRYAITRTPIIQSTTTNIRTGLLP